MLLLSRYCELLTNLTGMSVVNTLNINRTQGFRSPSASNIIDMNTDALKKSAAEAKEAAQDFMNSPQVQGAIDKGKEALEKGKEWINGPEGQKYVQKGKDMLEDVKDKVGDFMKDKFGSDKK
jgi:hypothetical protein